MWLFISLVREFFPFPQSHFKNCANVVELTLVNKCCPFKSLSQSANTFVLVNMPVRILTVALKIDDVSLHQSFILSKVSIIHFLTFTASVYSAQVHVSSGITERTL